VSLKTKNEYTLITNLDLINFNDDKIKEIYNSRWYSIKDGNLALLGM
jgi:hypothetical protein